MSNNKQISSPEDIDILRHGVIEAHAGTGKTYTIVKLVIRMLEQKSGFGGGFIQLKEILLVTYTEKAAGELKKRILDGISEEIKNLRSKKADENLITHLENCLNNMHEALIGTIHGVCLRLLQTWPFETGVHFSTQIIGDSQGAGEQLRESMRTDWQDESTRIPQMTRTLERYGIKFEQKHFDLICKIAIALMNDDGLAIDTQSDVNDIIENVKSCYSKVKDEEKLLNTLLKEYCGQLSALLDTGKLEADRQEVVRKLIERFGEMAVEGSYDVKHLSNPKKVARKEIYTAVSRKNIEGYAAIIDGTADKIKNHQYITASEQLNNLQSQLLLALITAAGRLLAIRYKTYKKQKGFISYNDMLELTARALYTKNSQVLKTLRTQLSYGIIDEFQDTSVLQWKIFKKIFLSEDNSTQSSAKMFIVGDPKQSIYSFQNADIQSYISAKKTITELGGTVYSLVYNYRSLPEVIRGYNAILSPQFTAECNNGEDWFLFGEEPGANSITYPTNGNARAPERAESPDCPAIQTISQTDKRAMKAVQIISMTDVKTDERKSLASKVCKAIKNLKGKTVSLPDGLKWKNLTLDYKDFAVIVETHALAQPFIDELRINGIPCVKYKQTGVFNSPMARDLCAVLTAILKKDETSERIGKEETPACVSAMLTHFFNSPPHLINQEQALQPCGAQKHGGGEMCCAAHSFYYWSFLAGKQLWAQLFRNILEKTKIRERLIALTDGERHLADLRQVTDYCISMLYSNNCGLGPLTDHLERLYKSEEHADGDKNIHTLSTDKSSVKILTMHAAKGLEFPVVFVVNSETKELPRSPNFLIWRDKNDNDRKLTPYLSDPKANPELSSAVANYKAAQRQERRRLFYVALTRAQAMLFTVMRDPKKEKELSPHLNELLNKQNPCAELFDEEQFMLSDTSSKLFDKSDIAETSNAAPKEIPELLLKPFITKQTSYSQLSRNLSVHRDVDKSEEYATDDITEDIAADNTERKLPGGRIVGDALHRVMEELLGISDLQTALKNETLLTDITSKYLKRGGVFNLSSADEYECAVKEAAQHISAALSAPLTLPCGSTTAIADIPKRDRIAEMEFLLSFGPHWIGGFMDFVFRVRNENHAPHPYRYYIIDWKSDSLKSFDRETVNEHCIKSHYDLQAKIYCLALDKYLKGILADRYNPSQNLGGSLHLFLRGFGAGSINGKSINSSLWLREASPIEDENELQKAILK